MAHELNVWLFGQRVGQLALVHGRLSFAYAPAWLEQPQAVALSQSLPLQAEAFDDVQTRPFFAGLLPEGQMRRLIAQTDRRFNRMRPSIAPRKRHQAG